MLSIFGISPANIKLAAKSSCFCSSIKQSNFYRLALPATRKKSFYSLDASTGRRGEGWTLCQSIQRHRRQNYQDGSRKRSRWKIETWFRSTTRHIRTSMEDKGDLLQASPKFRLNWAPERLNSPRGFYFFGWGSSWRVGLGPRAV